MTHVPWPVFPEGWRVGDAPKAHFLNAAEVQKRATRIVRSGSDAIIQSATGSGKTMAFLMPLLSALVYPPEAYPESFLVGAHRLSCRAIYMQIQLASRQHGPEKPLLKSRLPHHSSAWKGMPRCCPWHSACLLGKRTGRCKNSGGAGGGALLLL